MTDDYPDLYLTRKQKQDMTEAINNSQYDIIERGSLDDQLLTKSCTFFDRKKTECEFIDKNTAMPNDDRDLSKDLSDYPDHSDKVMSDYRYNKYVLGLDVPAPIVSDLDTDTNYVNFIKNTIKSVVESENEFIDSSYQLRRAISRLP